MNYLKPQSRHSNPGTSDSKVVILSRLFYVGSQKNKLIVIIIIVISHQVWERSSDRKDKKGCVSPKLSGFKDNNLVFLMILQVLPELTHAAAVSWWLWCGWVMSGGLITWMGPQLGRLEGMAGWLSLSLDVVFHPRLLHLKTEAFKMEKARILGALKFHKVKPHSASPDKEWGKRLHLQMGGTGNNLWPFKIHQTSKQDCLVVI